MHACMQTRQPPQPSTHQCLHELHADAELSHPAGSKPEALMCFVHTQTKGSHAGASMQEQQQCWVHRDHMCWHSTSRCTRRHADDSITQSHLKRTERIRAAPSAPSVCNRCAPQTESTVPAARQQAQTSTPLAAPQWAACVQEKSTCTHATNP